MKDVRDKPAHCSHHRHGRHQTLRLKRGLFKAHRLVHRSTLGLRVIKKKKKRYRGVASRLGIPEGDNHQEVGEGLELRQRRRAPDHSASYTGISGLYTYIWVVYGRVSGLCTSATARPRPLCIDSDTQVTGHARHTGYGFDSTGLL